MDIDSVSPDSQSSDSDTGTVDAPTPLHAPIPLLLPFLFPCPYWDYHCS